MKRGLINPGTLLINELNKEKNEIALFEAKQRELHVGQRERLAIPQVHHHAQNHVQNVDEDEGEGGDAVPRQLGRLNLEESILYE